MTSFEKLFRAGVSSLAIASCVALGVTVIADTYAANFNKQQCTVENGNVRGLAIQENGSVSCVCPSSSSALLDKKQRKTGSASSEECYLQTPNKITNFNQPTPTTGPT